MNIAWIRLIAVSVTAVNALLTSKGYNPIPFSEEEIYEGLTWVALVASILWSWYKNNNTSTEAKEAQVFLNQLKNRKK